MSVFDTKKNKSICVLPWVHEYKTISGKTGPCCYARQLQGNETIEQVRQEMLDGVQPRVCKTCYIKEEGSGYSPRINETISWLKKFGEPATDSPSIQFIDIRYDPTCNLKCKMCGPESSTLWQKERKVKFIANEDNKKYLHSVNKKDLKKVYLAGGEPTYIKDYLVFLQELNAVNPDCEVIINTNLKKLSVEWKEIFKKFKNLTVVCSCDAIDKLGVYVRYPLGWDDFEENVKWVSENVNFLQFNLVAMNITSHKLFETCTWMKKYSNNINLSILEGPEYFLERAVPLDQRHVYIKNIEKLVKFPVSVHYAMNFRTKIQYLLKKYSTDNFDENLHSALRQEIDAQDQHRTLQLDDVDQFLHQWIYR